MFTTNVKKMREAVQAAFSELEDIENEAAGLRESIDQYEAARQHNHSVATRRAALESARDALKGEYAEASFEGDTERLTAAQTRRTEIDEELAELASVEAVKPDGYALMDIISQANDLKFLHFGTQRFKQKFGILQPLYEELDALEDEHRRRKYAAIDGFSNYISSEDEHDYKMENDGGYRKSERERTAREQERREENMRLYGTEEPDFENTDEMIAAMDRAKAKRRQQVSA